MARPRFRELSFDETQAVYADGLDFKGYVEMDDFSVSSERRCSTNYCNCVALAAVGLEAGLLGHFEKISEPGKAQDRFHRAVAALKEVKPELIVLAGGCEEDKSFPIRFAVADRSFAANALGIYMDSDPAATLITHWNCGDAEAVNVHVDPAHAQITVVNVYSVPYAGYPGMDEY